MGTRSVSDFTLSGFDASALCWQDVKNGFVLVLALVVCFIEKDLYRESCCYLATFSFSLKAGSSQNSTSLYSEADISVQTSQFFKV